MKQSRVLISGLGSLWLAGALLLLILVAMACATVFESHHGTEQALVVFYKAWWFQGLLVLLAVNLLAAVAARWPLTRRQIGFLLTHLSIVIILVGAWISQRCGIDAIVQIKEGQTTSTYTLRQDVLSIERTGSTERMIVDLDFAAEDRHRIIEHPAVPAASVGDVQLVVQRYAPDSRETQEVVDDSPDLQSAVEIAVSAGTQNITRWIFADPQADGESAGIAMRSISDRQEFDRILTNQATTRPSSKGTLKIDVADSHYELPIEQCMDSAVPVGQTPYTVRVLQYYNHAVVGTGHQVQNASSQPVNPAVEVEINGPKGVVKRLVFARFPEFWSLHGNKKPDDLNLVFISSVNITSGAAIEILTGPDNQLAARFNMDNGRTIVRKLTLGAPCEMPWPGMVLKINSLYAHARRKQTIVPLETASESATPAILLAVKTPDMREELWLRKYGSRLVTVSGIDYRIAYRDKISPLGFQLTLDRFRIGYYPGTERPRSFESQVIFVDPATSREQSRVISMNQPARHGRFTFYQSSYQQDPEGGQATSILSVSWDPGQPIVFTGYGGMLIGMLWVLVIRLRARRSREDMPTDNIHQSKPAGEPAQGGHNL